MTRQYRLHSINIQNSSLQITTINFDILSLLNCMDSNPLLLLDSNAYTQNDFPQLNLLDLYKIALQNPSSPWSKRILRYLAVQAKFSNNNKTTSLHLFSHAMSIIKELDTCQDIEGCHLSQPRHSWPRLKPIKPGSKARRSQGKKTLNQLFPNNYSHENPETTLAKSFGWFSEYESINENPNCRFIRVDPLIVITELSKHHLLFSTSSDWTAAVLQNWTDIKTTIEKGGFFLDPRYHDDKSIIFKVSCALSLAIKDSIFLSKALFSYFKHENEWDERGQLPHKNDFVDMCRHLIQDSVTLHGELTFTRESLILFIIDRLKHLSEKKSNDNSSQLKKDLNSNAPGSFKQFFQGKISTKLSLKASRKNYFEIDLRPPEKRFNFFKGDGPLNSAFDTSLLSLALQTAKTNNSNACILSTEDSAFNFLLRFSTTNFSQTDNPDIQKFGEVAQVICEVLNVYDSFHGKVMESTLTKQSTSIQNSLIKEYNSHLLDIAHARLVEALKKNNPSKTINKLSSPFTGLIYHILRLFLTRDTQILLNARILLAAPLTAYEDIIKSSQTPEHDNEILKKALAIRNQHDKDVNMLASLLEANKQSHDQPDHFTLERSS